MFCTRCGKEIDDDNTFCPYCGAKIEEDLSSNKEEHKPSGKNTIATVVIALVIIAVIAAGAVFVINNSKNKETTDNNMSESVDNASSDNETVDNEMVEDQKQYPEGAEAYGGHYYLVVDEPMYWEDALHECENMGGHLASVTSKEEQEFIASLIEKNGSKQNYWLGGTDAGQEGNWVWVTGEPWIYTNWRESQPDNRNNEDEDMDQNYLQICCGSTDSDRYMMWWDVANSGKSIGYEDYPNFKDTKYTGYICEWDD